MSNGLTSVFISVLALSGSILASSNIEKELVRWLSEHDQSVLGIGTVGFYVNDIPWSVDGFEQEKRFIYDMIEGALQKNGWSSLSYEPNMEYVKYALSEFRRLIDAMQVEDITEIDEEWIKACEENQLLKNPEGYPRCDKHGVILHFGGCVICNDGM